MASIPILRFPAVVQDNIINQMDIIDVIELTTLSTKFKNAVRYVRVEIDELSLELSDDSNKISLYKGNRQLNFVLADIKQWTIRKLEGNIVGWFSAGEQPDDFNYKVFEIQLKSRNEETEVPEIMGKLTKHLLSILKVKTFNVHLQKTFDFKNLFIWNHINKINKLQIMLSVDPEITEDQFHYILDDVNAEELGLYLKVSDFKFQSAFRCPIYDIYDCSWIDFSRFSLGENCRRAYFTYSDITNDEYHNLVEKWMRGEYEKLEQLEFLFEDDNRLVEQEILRGFNAEPNTFTVYQLLTRCNSFPADITKTIKRTTDGRLATIGIRRDWVGFFAWHPAHLEEIPPQVDPDAEEEE